MVNINNNIIECRAGSWTVRGPWRSTTATTRCWPRCRRQRKWELKLPASMPGSVILGPPFRWNELKSLDYETWVLINTKCSWMFLKAISLINFFLSIHHSVRGVTFFVFNYLKTLQFCTFKIIYKTVTLVSQFVYILLTTFNVNSGIYMMQNTMIREGGGKWPTGKKMKRGKKKGGKLH